MERRAGFEPATSRVADEVTAIFTTDRETVGGEQATLLLLRRALTELRHFCRRDLNHATSEPQKRTALLPEVTDVFTTAWPNALVRLAIEKARWGTADLGLNDANAGAS